MEPLSRETLIKQGSCCGNKCKNCPYNRKWIKGSTKLSFPTYSIAAGTWGQITMAYNPLLDMPLTPKEMFGSCNSNLDCSDGAICANGECIPTPSAFDEALSEHSRIMERLLNPFKDLGTEEEAKIALDTQRKLAGNNLQYIQPGQIYYDYEDQEAKYNTSDCTLVLNVPYDAITIHTVE